LTELKAPIVAGAATAAAGKILSEQA
jgi:hypothetical protein